MHSFKTKHLTRTHAALREMGQEIIDMHKKFDPLPDGMVLVDSRTMVGILNLARKYVISEIGEDQLSSRGYMANHMEN